MRIDSINMQIQELMDNEVHRVFLNSLGVYLILSVIIICLVYGLYLLARTSIDTTSKKSVIKRRIVSSVMVIVPMLVMAGVSYLFITDEIKQKQNEFEKYKETAQYTDGKHKLDTVFWNYDLEVELENYIAELPSHKTKEYTDFNYTDNGIEFYFKGKLRTSKNTDLFTLVDGKKPILLYKEIDNDIYGIHKKGDIVDIKFITNY